MAIYTFNNKCLEFDNKLITKTPEPPTPGWYAREFNNYAEYYDFMDLYYDNFDLEYPTFNVYLKFNEPHTTIDRFWFDTAQLSAGDNFYVANKLVKIFDKHSVFVVSSYYSNIKYNNGIIAQHNFFNKLIDSVSDYGVVSSDFKITLGEAGHIRNGYSAAYDKQYGNKPHFNGDILTYPTYFSGYDNSYNNLFAEGTSGSHLFWSGDNEDRNNFKHISANIEDTYLLTNSAPTLWNIKIDFTNLRYKTWSANSAVVMNTLASTTYQFSATNFDIFPPNNYKMWIAFDNTVYPSAIYPRGVIFYQD